MKITYQVGPVLAYDVGAQLVDELIGICPEGKGTRAHSFKIRTTERDPRLSSVISILEGRGLKPCLHGATPTSFSLRIERHYDRADLVAARLLEFYPKPSLLEVTTTPFPGGPLQVPACHISSRLTIFDLSLGVFGVTRPVKQAMEAAALRGVAFLPIEVTGGGAGRWTGYLWQLISSIQMPMLAPSCNLVYAGVQSGPFDGDYSRMVAVEEGFYAIPEKHYRNSDLEELGELALGHALERFGHVGEQTLIAGKPFYEFCLMHKLKMDWVPVRIDPD